jgi:hypothetical protein
VSGEGGLMCRERSGAAAAVIARASGGRVLIVASNRLFLWACEFLLVSRRRRRGCGIGWIGYECHIIFLLGFVFGRKRGKGWGEGRVEF